MPTNHWIKQGGNAQIIMDMIHRSLHQFPLVAPPNSTSKSIPLTQGNLIKFFLFLIVLPLLFIGLTRYFFKRSNRNLTGSL